MIKCIYPQAKKLVGRFELMIERTLYKYLVKQLNSAWENGIKYHVLGYGLMTFYPCIAFFCGDDPCQHRISGLQEGNSAYGCVFCLFPTTKGIVYDPAKHPPRDPDAIRRWCAIAEEVACMEMGDIVATPITKNQKEALLSLQKQNVHCHENPFHYAPMGHNNNIFKANPPDLLHLFCAGLMKSLTQWVLTIIVQVNMKCKGFKTIHTC